jgi:hypothetical protein
MSSGSTLALAPHTGLNIAGGGTIDVRSPNLLLGANSSLNATGASNIFIDSGNSATNVNLNIIGPSAGSGTISTNGGTIDVSPTGLGNITFKGAGNGNTAINLNAAGTSGQQGLVDVHGLGNITISKGVLLATNSPIQFNMDNGFGPVQQTFTLNGIVKTTASNAPFPDPISGFMYYSILVQNLISNFNLAGTGTFLQAGATPGNTVFNDFTDVGFANGTHLNLVSLNPGSYANFYTRQIQLNGIGASAASLNLKGMNGINFNTNLPSFGPGDVAFVTGPTATSGTLAIAGAPVTVGFEGSPPVSIPAAQEPVSNITIGPKFTLLSNNPVSLFATNSVNILGRLLASGGNGQLTAESPSGDNLDVSGTGALLGNHIVMSSTGSDTGVNFKGHLQLVGSTLINAPNGPVTISNGSTVTHHGSVLINSPDAVPSGFVPTCGVTQIHQPGNIPNPKLGSITIVTPNLNVLGSIQAHSNSNSQ